MFNLDGIDLSSCISVESFASALHFVEGVRSLNCRSCFVQHCAYCSIWFRTA
jgi:hypothetical protein